MSALLDSRFPDTATRELFAEDVFRMLGRDAEIGGKRTQGESLSALRTDLSSRWNGALSIESGRRWSGLSRYCDFVDALREAGFRVERGRMLRHFRGGVYKPGQPCDVVTL